jgi:hypothetical protein
MNMWHIFVRKRKESQCKRLNMSCGIPNKFAVCNEVLKEITATICGKETSPIKTLLVLSFRQQRLWVRIYFDTWRFFAILCVVCKGKAVSLSSNQTDPKVWLVFWFFHNTVFSSSWND